MSDLKVIKKRILQEDKIPDILTALNCHNIKEKDNRYEAQMDGSSNTRSVQVYKNESLTIRIRNRDVVGDIMNLVAYLKFNCNTVEEQNQKLHKSKSFILDTLGWQDYYKSKYKQTENHLSWLKQLKSKRFHSLDLSKIEANKTLDPNVLHEYIMLPTVFFTRDGIPYEVQELFGVGFDIDTRRTVFCCHDKNGNLIGVKGKTIERSDKKYLYLHRFSKEKELFNLHRAIESIKETKKVYVFESEQSVMRMWAFGYKNCLALAGDSISSIQVQLLKNLGKDVEIIFCYDKDKDLEFVQRQANKISNRDLYVIFDTKNLLSDKQNMTDQGKETCETMMNECCYYIGNDDE